MPSFLRTTESSDPNVEVHCALDELVQRAPAGMTLFDRELRLIRINHRLATRHGIAPEAALGRRLSELLPGLGERLEQIVRSVFESGEPLEGVEASGEMPDEPGRCRHWIASYLPFRLGANEVGAVGAVVHEVTARREVEDALRTSEARYRYLYLRTPAMMHSIDHEGRIVDVSDAWLERMGYTRDEVLGRRSVEFLTPASREYAVNTVLPAFFRTGVCKDIEYQLIRKDGVVIDILLSAVAERDAAGRYARSLAVLVDVTERKRAEAALRHSEAQLRQAQKMEAIGRLAGGVAHDFNNLLVVMLGNAELLKLALADPALREWSSRRSAAECAEQIVLAGERGAALTRQILRFSRQQVVQPCVLDLNELIVDVEGLLRRLLREDIEVVTALRSSLGRVSIDPGQATQVLMNLAVNASDAMPHGGRLLIETADVTCDVGGPCAPGEHVLLTVTDTGLGMDAETQARVFEPFFTTKVSGRGTGLGLATVYGIVRQNGGCITVHSEPGQGSSFRVYLPQVQAVEERDAEPLGADTVAVDSATVLVIEDDEMVRRLITDVLREHDYEVLSARDADEAALMAVAHPRAIDVILTDVVMPGTAPAVVVEQVRARHPNVRVIYMSGYAAGDTAQIEPQQFLAKPFTMEGLLRKLQGARARTVAPRRVAQ